MKSKSDFEQDRSLDGALKAWTVRDPLPPRFQEGVWERLSRSQEPSSLLTQFRAALRAVEGALTRPKLAVSYLAILLLLGMAAGSWAAQKQNNRLDATLGSRYLQAINPYQAAADR